jgi:hypothetical protein
MHSQKLPATRYTALLIACFASSGLAWSAPESSQAPDTKRTSSALTSSRKQPSETAQAKYARGLALRT